jgi:hypothetical protein
VDASLRAWLENLKRTAESGHELKQRMAALDEKQ